MQQEKKEKMRSSKFDVKRILGIAITLIVLGLAALWIIQQGERAYRQLAHEEKAWEDENKDLNDYASQYFYSRYNIYYLLENKRHGKEYMNYEDIFFQKRDLDGEEVPEDTWVIERYMNIGRYLIESECVDYLMVDDTSELSVASIDNADFVNAIKNRRIPEELKEYYKILVLLGYDSEGNLSIYEQSGVNQDRIFSLYNDSETITKKMHDVTLLLAVKEEAYEVMKSYYGPDYDFKYYNFVYERFLVISVIAVAVVGICAILLMVLGLIGNRKNWITKVPVEISGAATILLACAYESMADLSFSLYQNTFMDGILGNVLGVSTTSQRSAKLIGIGVWFLYFLAIFMCAVALLQVFRKGIGRFIKENSLIYIFLRWSIKNVKRATMSFLSFEFGDPTNQMTLKIVGVNAVAIAIMCSIWFFGLGVLVIYSIVLFFVLRRYLQKVTKDYEKVLNTTKEMAKGNLDVNILDDYGIFEPIKEELKQVKEGFAHAVSEELKSQNMRTELITNVSHDLKTPLTAIITYIDLLKDESLNEEQRKAYVDTLDRKSQRLKQLIEDLFEVSKLNSNNVELQRVEVELVSLIKQVQYEYEERFGEKDIRFIPTYPEEKVKLFLDSQKTYRIFENLFGNIAKYAMPNTRAYMEVKQNGNQVMIILKNISEHEITQTGEVLTERFVRGDESRTTEGSGLGLAIVKSLVEKQGGAIQIVVDGDLFKVEMSFPNELCIKPKDQTEGSEM